MDQRGSLIDTSVRIYPSEKFLTFLKQENFKGYVPSNIKILLKDKSYRLSDEKDCKTNEIDIHLHKSDVEFLNKISDKLKKNKLDKLSEGDINKETEKIENETENNIKKANEEAVLLPNVKENIYSDIIDDKNLSEESEGLYLTISDIDWLYLYITEQRRCNKEIPYLHDILEGCKIDLPDNEIIKRNPILEARCVKLRAQQEAREYRKMTKSVDNVRMKFPEDSISYQLKQLNRQLIAIGQFIISIFAGFLFGFKGVEWTIGSLDFGFRLLLGVMCALIIALAEIYFLAKKLNEELSVPETTQLGGPPRFVDESLNEFRNKKTVIKPHQD